MNLGPGVMIYAFNPVPLAQLVDSLPNTREPSIQEVEGAEVQGHPWLHIKFRGSLNCMKPCLKK